MTGNKVFNIEVATEQVILGWAGFQKCISFNTNKKIAASPTDTNFVYRTLINVNKMLANLGQTDPYIAVNESI